MQTFESLNNKRPSSLRFSDVVFEISLYSTTYYDHNDRNYGHKDMIYELKSRVYGH